MTITRVPNGNFGIGAWPASARKSCAATNTAIPHQRVGMRVPVSGYRALRLSWPTADSATPLLEGS